MRRKIRNFALAGSLLAALGVISDSQPPASAALATSGVLVFTRPVIFSQASLAEQTSNIQEIFTVNADGSGLRQLTNDGMSKFLPHYSPDGQSLIYTKYIKGFYDASASVTVVALLNLTTGRETLLTQGGQEMQPVWSPDGLNIAYTTQAGDGLWTMQPNVSGATLIARPKGTPDDLRWADLLWGSDNWIYFTVAQNINGCFKVRIDRIRPDASHRDQITDGGPNCTSEGLQQSGDADPGVSPDAQTLYSSRGLPQTMSIPGAPTLRHLYKFSTAPYAPGKVERDLSFPREARCIAGVPKVAPDGKRIALFLGCPSSPQPVGIAITDPDGAQYVFITHGFGPDWKPIPSLSQKTGGASGSPR